MQVSQISELDARMMVQVINALKVAKFNDLGTKDIDALAASVRWLTNLASQMGQTMQASSTAAAAPTTGMRIKSAGSLSPSSKHAPGPKSKKKK